MARQAVSYTTEERNLAKLYQIPVETIRALSTSPLMTKADLEKQESERRQNELATAAAARKQRENAWPVLVPGTKVKADVTGWRTDDCQVAEDIGPASDGSRKITVEKIAREQRITVRRDRVRAVTA